MTGPTFSATHDFPRPASLASLKLVYKGKVRDVYELSGDYLLIVTSQRVSAYDVVFPEPVPHKAEVLNMLSAHWFERTQQIIPNHVIETRAARIFSPGSADATLLRGRVMAVRRCEPIRFECVVRGHLDGSAWREYQKTGKASGHPLPPGMKRYAELPERLFTPTTKAETGHDEAITFDEMKSRAGVELAEDMRQTSMELFDFGVRQLAPRNIQLLDTKFEFGRWQGELMLIDECLTPDSSRFRYCHEGQEPEVLDKQFLRDWLAEKGFTGEGTPPKLDAAVIAELGRRYERAFELITGAKLQAVMEMKG